MAALVLELAAARKPTLGTGRLGCLDGPGGSGKTTLAAALADLVPGAAVVHMDNLYDGWSGMRAGADQLGPLLGALAEGRSGTYRRYDWDAAAFAETVSVEPASLLVLEGVGSGVRATPTWSPSWCGWVPPQLRLARGLERDGAGLQQQWGDWMGDEDDLDARELTHQRADLVVDGTGRLPPAVRPAVPPTVTR